MKRFERFPRLRLEVATSDDVRTVSRGALQRSGSSCSSPEYSSASAPATTRKPRFPGLFYDVDVDSKIIDLKRQDDERLNAALASAGAELVRLKPPRFVVRVRAGSESAAQRQAVEALERWASGPGAGWNVVGTTAWDG